MLMQSNNASVGFKVIVYQEPKSRHSHFSNKLYVYWAMMKTHRALISLVHHEHFPFHFYLIFRLCGCWKANQLLLFSRNVAHEQEFQQKLVCYRWIFQPEDCNTGCKVLFNFSKTFRSCPSWRTFCISHRQWYSSWSQWISYRHSQVCRENHQLKYHV